MFPNTNVSRKLPMSVVLLQILLLSILFSTGISCSTSLEHRNERSAILLEENRATNGTELDSEEGGHQLTAARSSKRRMDIGRATDVSHSLWHVHSGIPATPLMNSLVNESTRIFTLLSQMTTKFSQHHTIQPIPLVDCKYTELQIRRDILYSTNSSALRLFPNFDPRVTHPFTPTVTQKERTYLSNPIIAKLVQLDMDWDSLKALYPDIVRQNKAGIHALKTQVEFSIDVQIAAQARKTLLAQERKFLEELMYTDSLPQSSIELLRSHFPLYLALLEIADCKDDALEIASPIANFIDSQFDLVVLLNGLSVQRRIYLNDKMKSVSSESVTPLIWTVIVKTLLDHLTCESVYPNNWSEDDNAAINKGIASYFKTLHGSLLNLCVETSTVNINNTLCERRLLKSTYIQHTMEVCGSETVASGEADKPTLTFCNKIIKEIIRRNINLTEIENQKQLARVLGRIYVPADYRLYYKKCIRRYLKPPRTPNQSEKQSVNITVNYGELLFRIRKLMCSSLDDVIKLDESKNLENNFLLANAQTLLRGAKPGRWRVENVANQLTSGALSIHHILDVMLGLRYSKANEDDELTAIKLREATSKLEKLQSKFEEISKSSPSERFVNELNEICEETERGMFDVFELVWKEYKERIPRAEKIKGYWSRIKVDIKGKFAHPIPIQTAKLELWKLSLFLNRSVD